MTGFGRATVDAGAGRGRLRVEIRSVNHRGLDLKVRATQPDAYCEAEIGRAVRASPRSRPGTRAHAAPATGSNSTRGRDGHGEDGEAARAARSMLRETPARRAS